MNLSAKGAEAEQLDEFVDPVVDRVFLGQLGRRQIAAATGLVICEVAFERHRDGLA